MINECQKLGDGVNETIGNLGVLLRAQDSELTGREAPVSRANSFNAEQIEEISSEQQATEEAEKLLSGKSR